MTAIWSAALNSDIAGTGPLSVRAVLGGVAQGTWKDFRFRLSAHSTQPTAVAAASFGLRDANFDTVGSPVPLTVGGQASFTIPAGQTVWSDPAPATITMGPGDSLIGCLDLPSGALAVRQAIPGATQNRFGWRASYASASLASVTGFADIPGRSHTIDKVEATAVTGGGGRLLASATITSPVQEVILVSPEVGVKKSTLRFFNIASDKELIPQSGAVFTMFLSVDGGQTFDHGYTYVSSGMRTWIPGWWPPTQITGDNWIDPIQTGDALVYGCRIGIDTGDTTAKGLSGHVDIYSPGTVGGVPVDTSYLSYAVKGTMGVVSGISRRQDNNALYFPNPHGQQVRLPMGVYYNGFYDGATGQSVNAIKVTCNQIPGLNINLVQGELEWIAD